MTESSSLTLASPFTAPVADLVSSDLPQIKVNRCLIALVGKKAVTKVNEGVSLSLLLCWDLSTVLTSACVPRLAGRRQLCPRRPRWLGEALARSGSFHILSTSPVNASFDKGLRKHLAEGRALALFALLLSGLDAREQVRDGRVGRNECLGGRQVGLGALVILHLVAGERPAVERLGLLLGLQGRELKRLSRQKKGERAAERRDQSIVLPLRRASQKLTRWAWAST